MDTTNYKDFYIDINTFDTDSISYTKPILFYKVNRNMGIYYKKEVGSDLEDQSIKSNKSKIPIPIPHTNKQKIIVQTPKMLVPFGIKEFKNDTIDSKSGKKTYQMCLSFSTLTNLYNEDEIKKFYSLVKKIDKANESTISDYKKEWGLPKSMTYKKTLQQLNKDFPHHMGLNLPYDENSKFSFGIYDENALESSIDIIGKKSIVSVVLELTDLRFSDTEFKANWTVLQIRKFKPYSPIQEFFMTRCFICDDDDPEDKAFATLIEQNKIMYQQQLQKFQQLQQMQYMQQMQYVQQFQQFQPQMNQMNQLNQTNQFNQFIPQPQVSYNRPDQNYSQSRLQLEQSVNKGGSQSQPPSKPSGSFIPPSKDDLINGLKSLKKTVTIDKTNPIAGKILDEDDEPMVISSRPAPPKRNLIKTDPSTDKNKSDIKSDGQLDKDKKKADGQLDKDKKKADVQSDKDKKKSDTKADVQLDKDKKKADVQSDKDKKKSDTKADVQLDKDKKKSDIKSDTKDKKKSDTKDKNISNTIAKNKANTKINKIAKSESESESESEEAVIHKQSNKAKSTK